MITLNYPEQPIITLNYLNYPEQPIITLITPITP